MFGTPYNKPTKVFRLSGPSKINVGNIIFSFEVCLALNPFLAVHTYGTKDSISIDRMGGAVWGREVVVRVTMFA